MGFLSSLGSRIHASLPLENRKRLFQGMNIYLLSLSRQDYTLFKIYLQGPEFESKCIWAKHSLGWSQKGILDVHWIYGL